MNSLGSESTTVSVDDVAAMTDAELADSMTKHRRPDGCFELPIDGFEKLDKDELDRLSERLKAQQRSLARSPTASSHPLDLDELDARLLQVTSDKGSTVRLEPRGDELSKPSLLVEHELEEDEAIDYHKLVSYGGRPLYPVDLIPDVYKNPDDHAEMLRPWQQTLDETHPEGIFHRQLSRWKEFNKWQDNNRGREEDDGGFPAFVEQFKHDLLQNHLPEYAFTRLAEIEADPSFLEAVWEGIQRERANQRHYCREPGCRGLREYAEAVKRRLARHGFTPSFELDEDPKTQDRMTTWIEYLSYEYWCLDKYTGDIERLEPERDRLWRELVDMTILKPHETREYVRSFASASEHQNELDQAWEAVKRAEAEAERVMALGQEDPKRANIPQAKHTSMMRASTEKLNAAKQRLEDVQSRVDHVTRFVRGTSDYYCAKRKAGTRRVLCQWARDQVPLIEAEEKAAEAQKYMPEGRRPTKRLSPDDDASEVQDQET